MQPQLFVQTRKTASDSPLIPVPDFAAVAEYRDRGELAVLGVGVGDFLALVDLDSGSLTLGTERYDVQHPGAPLRPIYYKQMSADSSLELGTTTRLEFVALGWQATVDGRNVRFGAKLFPAESRYVLTEEV